MDNLLKVETEKLKRSWMQHEAAHLRDYLVASVEDPRINLQSILARHFLLREVFDRRFELLMEEECRFAAVMNWLRTLGAMLDDSEMREALAHAMRNRADNAEGIAVPGFVAKAYRSLPPLAAGIAVPNYLETFLNRQIAGGEEAGLGKSTLDTFQNLWATLLSSLPQGATPSPSVLEPAGGSANEYRFLDSYGIARFIEYTGFDLCDKNVTNAQAMYPGIRFDARNVFDIEAPDKSFDLCFLHDLLEHLSVDGIETAAKELCRVTRRALCIGFFQMDERPDHVIRQVDEYYWNTLSMDRMRSLFSQHGFRSQVIHLATFLRQEFDCAPTHNQNAYTLILERESPAN